MYLIIITLVFAFLLIFTIINNLLARWIYMSTYYV